VTTDESLSSNVARRGELARRLEGGDAASVDDMLDEHSGAGRT